MLETAYVMTGSTGTVTRSNAAATMEVGDPERIIGMGERPLWHQFTSTYGGVLTIDTEGSEIDTVLEVFVGTPPDLKVVGINDDEPGGEFWSTMTFRVQGGQTYWIRANSWDEGGAGVGDVKLNWSLLSDPVVQLNGIPSAGQIGTLKVGRSIRLNSIVGGTVGVPTIHNAAEAIVLQAVPSAEVIGVPKIGTFRLVTVTSSIPSAEVIGTPTIVASSGWWSSRWPYRRTVTITAPLDQEVPVGHPIVLTLSSTVHGQGKLRDDYADLEVLHFVDDVWRRIPRRVTEVNGNLEVRYLTDVYLSPGASDTYYVHYGYPDSTGAGRANFVDNPWPIVVPYNSTEISYTKPGEWWKQGITGKVGASASMEFDGTAVRLVSVKGPDDAMAELQLDDLPWQRADLWSPVEVPAEVMRWESLAPGAHKIRMRATGGRNPSSVGTTVDVLKFEFVTSVVTYVGPEEVLVSMWRQSGVGGG
jgi:hypothetical protein